MQLRSILIVVFIFLSASVHAQLKPGFDPDEYLEMLRVCAQQVDSGKVSVAGPKEFHREYRSPELGLDNRWDLWVNSDNTVAVISLRGTTAKTESWIENFYSAMVPATGAMKISDNYTFNYKFANDPKAAVQVGWTLGIGSLMPTILEQLNACYKRGIKQVLIMGHSQGGALAFLLRSQLYYLAQDGKFPKDVIIKTYCSAAPAPGNLFYAYDYDYINRDQWSFTVVNAADWVPETPVSVQTVKDFNKINPFTHIHAALKKQPFLVRTYGRHVYNQLRHPLNRSQRRFEKYLGKKLYKVVRKYQPQFEQPQYAHTSDYVRAGTFIVLQPDADYYKLFPDTSTNIFVHHLFSPYYYLTKKIYGK